jgi:hypothetical protein
MVLGPARSSCLGAGGSKCLGRNAVDQLRQRDIVEGVRADVPIREQQAQTAAIRLLHGLNLLRERQQRTFEQYFGCLIV